MSKCQVFFFKSILFFFQEEKAGQVIQHIRGPDYSVRAELKELVANASSNTTDNYSFKDVLKAVAKREFLAPFFSLLFLVTVQGKIKPNFTNGERALYFN